MARNEDVVKGFRTTSGIKKYDYAALENQPFGDNSDGTVTQLDGKYLPGVTAAVSGTTLTITNPDGTTSEVTLPAGTTYTLSVDGDKIKLTDKDGNVQTVTVKSLPTVTASDAGKVLKVSSSGAWGAESVTVDSSITQTGANPVTGAAVYNYVGSTITSALSASY